MKKTINQIVRRTGALLLCFSIIAANSSVSVMASDIQSKDIKSLEANHEPEEKDDVALDTSEAVSAENVSEDISSEENTYIYYSEENKEIIEVSPDYHGSGYIPEENLIVAPIAVEDECVQSDLPAKYIPDLNTDLPKLRDQGRYGLCWAFAMIATAEINLIKKGIVKADEIDLSEAALGYFTNCFKNDPLGNTKDESWFYDRYIYAGGNNSYAVHTFAKGIGLVDEKDAPYPGKPTDKIMTSLGDLVTVGGRVDDAYEYPDESLMYASKYHLKNAYTVNWEQRDLIKQMISQYGACLWNFSMGGEGGLSSYYYNRENNCFYMPYSSAPNHSVAIVGWDDNFPASNFKTDLGGYVPEGNGAYLVRNSWFSDEYYQSSLYDEQGYFWVSYYTGQGNPNVFFYDFVSAEDDYKNNYQYDGGINIRNLDHFSNNTKVSNVFTASASDNGEWLRAVYFEIPENANVNYTIHIYKNVIDTPDSGVEYEAAKTTGSTKTAGCFTIPLKDKVPLRKGEKYAVVIELNSDYEDVLSFECDEDSKEPCDSPYCHMRENYDYFDNWLNEKTNDGYCNITHGIGESFRFDTSNNKWIDRGSAVYRIKAFTDDRNPGERLPDIEKITWTENLSAGVKLHLGETYSPQYQLIPANAEPDIMWKSSNTNVVSIIGGVLKGNSIGQAVVTAYSAANNSIKASFKVTVPNERLIRFHGNGGFTEDGEDTYTEWVKKDEYSKLPPNRFLKQGFKIYCWNTKPDGRGYEYFPEKSITDIEGDDLYIIWRYQMIRLRLDANGGKVSNSSVYDIPEFHLYVHGVPVGDRVMEYTPVRPGFEFLGWYDQKVGGNKVTPETIGIVAIDHDKNNNPDMTFYARWRAEPVRVKFNPNGGIVDEESREIEPGTLYGELPTPVKAGYIFKGWYTKLTGGTLVTASTEITQTTSHTLFARWEQSYYYIRYDGNGSTKGIMKDVKVLMGKQYSIANSTYAKTGYLFAGWSFDKDDSTNLIKVRDKVVNLSSTDGDTVVLYAQWTPIQYTVKYAGNNANRKETMENMVATYDTMFELPENTFTRPGYTFKNWRSTTKIANVYRDFYAGDYVVSDWVVRNKGVITLKAIWEYELKLDPNGGIGEPVTLTQIEADSRYKLPASQYTKVGYTFAGWSQTPTGRVQYRDSSSISNLGGKTLYAVWSPKKYSVKYLDTSARGVTVATGKTITLPKAVKAGYGLNKWIVSNSETGKNIEYLPGSVITVDSTFVEDYVINNVISITAVWDELSINPAGISINVGDEVNLNSVLNYPMVGQAGYTVEFGDKTLLKINNRRILGNYKAAKAGDTYMKIKWTVGREKIFLECPVHIE